MICEEEMVDLRIADPKSIEEGKRLAQLALIQQAERLYFKPKISDSDLRMLVQKVLVHQNEDKSLDVQFIFNGAFEQSVTKYDDEQA